MFERLAAKKPAKEQSNQLVPVRLIDSVRQSKIGYYGSIEEGRMILDNRALFGIIC